MPIDSESAPVKYTPASSASNKMMLAGISVLVLVIVAALIAIIWMLFGGNSRVNPSAGNASIAATASASPEHATSETVETTEGVATAKPSVEKKSPEMPEKKAITPHSHPLAGGPRPPEAKAPTNVIKSEYGKRQTAIIVTPSGNIGCDIEHDPDASFGYVNYLSCSVSSWRDHAPVPPQNYNPEYDGLAFVSMDSEKEKPSYSGGKHDCFCFMENCCQPGSKPQVLNYGEMIYFADFVCASEKEGLSCWSVKSGHGALMSRNHFETY